jgi:hypothetical protein
MVAAITVWRCQLVDTTRMKAVTPDAVRLHPARDLEWESAALAETE